MEYKALALSGLVDNGKTKVLHSLSLQYHHFIRNFREKQDLILTAFSKQAKLKLNQRRRSKMDNKRDMIIGILLLAVSLGVVGLIVLANYYKDKYFQDWRESQKDRKFSP